MANNLSNVNKEAVRPRVSRTTMVCPWLLSKSWRYCYVYVRSHDWTNMPTDMSHTPTNSSNSEVRSVPVALVVDASNASSWATSPLVHAEAATRKRTFRYNSGRSGINCLFVYTSLARFGAMYLCLWAFTYMTREFYCQGEGSSVKPALYPRIQGWSRMSALVV